MMGGVGLPESTGCITGVVRPPIGGVGLPAPIGGVGLPPPGGFEDAGATGVNTGPDAVETNNGASVSGLLSFGCDGKVTLP